VRPDRCRKVSHVRTIDLVAKDLCEHIDFLFDFAIEVEPEHGMIWIRGAPAARASSPFTDDGVDSLIELVKIQREMMPRAPQMEGMRKSWSFLQGPERTNQPKRGSRR
jgi:hypothetical protein